ncbi:VOC family protein [Paenibacillus gansuensis]|uniref:VOC family protein n=1 Tax=Paenibacillus gansuensis TaxID=306542 RepID=A0ABW5PE42_9BACL
MGRVISFEINSQDPEKASSFYSEVFGWKMGEENWGYRQVSTGAGSQDLKGLDGGISEGPADYPHGVRLHLEVADMNQAISQAVLRGAKIVRDKMEFDDFFLAYLVDPVGIGLGLIQPKAGRTGENAGT